MALTMNSQERLGVLKGYPIGPSVGAHLCCRIQKHLSSSCGSHFSCSCTLNIPETWIIYKEPQYNPHVESHVHSKDGATIHDASCTSAIGLPLALVRLVFSDLAADSGKLKGPPNNNVL